MRSINHRSAALLAVCALTAAAVTACSSSSTSSGSPGGGSSSTGVAAGGTLQDLYTAAKQEGKVVVWGGEDPQELQGAFAEFSKTYPGLKLEMTAVNPDEQASKLATAQAAGQTLPDIIQGRREFMPTLVQAKLINSDPGWAGYQVPSNVVSADGGLVEYKSVYVLAYNTNVVKDTSTLPVTWDDLNNPQWKGKLSVDPRGFPFNVLAVSKGASATVDYVKSLKSTTSPAIIKGSTAGLVKLAAGAQAVRPAVLEDVKTQQGKGAPIGLKVPTPVLVQDTLWYLTSGAKDKAAAMLFAIWYTSANGGQLLTAKQDNRTNQLPAEANTGTVVSYDTADKAAIVASVTPQIASVLGGS
jgi:ABC-type Fe3+ transport system substrate-binding protein